MTVSRHWHGYLWSGTGAELKEEHLRRPGEPGSPEYQAFLRSSLPPMKTGHYLLRRGAASQDLTWTDAGPAIDWMATSYKRHLPMSGEAGFPAINGVAPMATDVGLDARRTTSLDGLCNGVDGFWLYYTGQSGSMVAICAICCPHTHMPEIACPMPPRT
jgi:hypothetical protein